MINLLRQRRSIRTYHNKPVEPEKLATLKEALLRSPSSRNIRPWEFIVVENRETIDKLSLAKQHGSTFLKGAPLVILILGDSQKSDVWIEDCSIAAIILQLTAQSLGLGSCWVQIRLRPHDDRTTAEEYVQRLFGFPEHLQVEAIIGIGYPAENRAGLLFENLQFEKIHLNQYHA